MKTLSLKLGHQAPKGIRINEFSSINIDGPYAYCISHNFIYNDEDEEEKLYNAQPCYHTDNRFVDSRNNFYHSTYLYNRRWEPISLKACIRRTLECRNIPIGTIVNFSKSWHYAGKKIDNSFRFKIKKENKFDIKYEINIPSFFDNFKTCEFSKNLTDALRANGFIVDVRSKNPNRLSSMLSTAASYAGKYIEVESEEGEVAIAYGYGKKIGFSSGKNSLFGYSYGCDNILWDHFGEFDKWSRCHEILKTTSIDEIIEILKNEKPEIN